MAKMSSLHAEQTMSRIITEDEWDHTYYPISDSPLNTWGEDLRLVRLTPKNNVWTLIEVDDQLLIVNGMHMVNRIGYYLTHLPWENEEVIVVKVGE